MVVLFHLPYDTVKSPGLQFRDRRRWRKGSRKWRTDNLEWKSRDSSRKVFRGDYSVRTLPSVGPGRFDQVDGRFMVLTGVHCSVSRRFSRSLWDELKDWCSVMYIILFITKLGESRRHQTMCWYLFLLLNHVPSGNPVSHWLGLLKRYGSRPESHEFGYFRVHFPLLNQRNYTISNSNTTCFRFNLLKHH